MTVFRRNSKPRYYSVLDKEMSIDINIPFRDVIRFCNLILDIPSRPDSPPPSRASLRPSVPSSWTNRYGNSPTMFFLFPCHFLQFPHQMPRHPTPPVIGGHKKLLYFRSRRPRLGHRISVRKHHQTCDLFLASVGSGLLNDNYLATRSYLGCL